jgi:hypothetical protein
MTPTQKAAMEMALEAMEKARPLKADYLTLEDYGFAKENHYAAMAALRAAMAEQSGSEDKADEMSPEFTDTARAALLWVLWHHQGGSSPIGQPIRYALGMGAHEHLNSYQVSEAKRWAEMTGSTTEQFHAREAVRLNMAPLSDEQIEKCWTTVGCCDYDEFEQIARAIEAAHGIKVD